MRKAGPVERGTRRAGRGRGQGREAWKTPADVTPAPCHVGRRGARGGRRNQAAVPVELHGVGVDTPVGRCHDHVWYQVPVLQKL